MASDVTGGGVDVVFDGTEGTRAAEVSVGGGGMAVDGTVVEAAASTEGVPEPEEDMADTRLLRRVLDLRK